MNNKFRCFFLLLILFIALRCTHDPVLIDPNSLGVYYLKGNISPNEPNCRVVIGHALPERMPEDLHNVAMICSGGGQSVAFTEQDFCIYQDKPTPLLVIPGQRYDISALTTDGVTLHAHTYVPGEFKLLKANLPDTLEYIIAGYEIDYYPFFIIQDYTLPVIEWMPSNHAFVYKIDMDKSEALYSFTQSSHLPLLSNWGNEYILNPEIREWVQNCQVQVTAYDSTRLPSTVNSTYNVNNQNEFIEKYIREWGYKTGYQDNNQGGIGYFSSCYTITDTLIIRFKKEIAPNEE